MSKKDLRRLMKLYQETTSLETSIDPWVRKVGARYVALKKEDGYSGPNRNDDFEWWLETKKCDGQTKWLIAIRWHETWGYGGEDSGIFYMPISMLFNPDELDDLEEKLRLERNHAKDLENKARVEQEKQLLIELAEKYPDVNLDNQEFVESN